jgi:dCMP deaminase
VTFHAFIVPQACRVAPSGDISCFYRSPSITCGITKPYVLHAEANAITKIARSNNSSEGATLYVTASPCIECAKLIIQAGIKRVVFAEKYRLEDGLELLKRANIELVYLTPNE